jgi:transposase
MKCFRMLGKKGDEHFDPADPPRCRANKQRGHGTYENDRPPVVGTVGRESGQVRLRVAHHTNQATLEQHVERFTLVKAHCNTDEWLGYNHILRMHSTVNHGNYEWARDDDGDGIREVHINTIEGLWTDLRIFLCTFKGINKRFLSGYVAIAEFRRNLKRISPDFIATLVTRHTSYT